MTFVESTEIVHSPPVLTGGGSSHWLFPSERDYECKAYSSGKLPLYCMNKARILTLYSYSNGVQATTINSCK